MKIIFQQIFLFLVFKLVKSAPQTLSMEVTQIVIDILYSIINIQVSRDHLGGGWG